MTARTEHVVKLVDRCIALLREHCDSVHIFCTRYDSESGDTASVNKGDGNWFARLGQVEEWVEKKREETRQEVRDEW